MNNKLWLLVLCFVWASLTLGAANDLVSVDYWKLISRGAVSLDHAAVHSEAGLPVGNGHMGSRIWTERTSIAVLWFDGLRDREKYNPLRFYKLVRELQPALLINNRIGVPADFDTPEERLREIGKWLKVNGEAIYGTTYGPLYGLPFGRTTAKDSTVYLHVFDWPSGKRALDVPSQPSDPHVSVLALETP